MEHKKVSWFILYFIYTSFVIKYPEFPCRNQWVRSFVLRHKNKIWIITNWDFFDNKCKTRWPWVFIRCFLIGLALFPNQGSVRFLSIKTFLTSENLRLESNIMRTLLLGDDHWFAFAIWNVFKRIDLSIFYIIHFPAN